VALDKVRIRVDPELCALTGQCVTVAPEIFWFEGDELVHQPWAKIESHESVRRAVEYCPMGAIAIVGEHE
jgi:ferredoxin